MFMLFMPYPSRFPLTLLHACGKRVTFGVRAFVEAESSRKSLMSHRGMNKHDVN
jgi:hypothetical protein